MLDKSNKEQSMEEKTKLIEEVIEDFSTPHSSDQGLPFLNLIFNEIIGCCYC